MYFRSNVFSSKYNFGQMIIPANVNFGKCIFGQMILQSSDFRANVRSGKYISIKCNFWKVNFLSSARSE